MTTERVAFRDDPSVAYVIQQVDERSDTVRVEQETFNQRKNRSGWVHRDWLVTLDTSQS